MYAEFDQNGLELGYARIRLIDASFEEGDGIAFGKMGATKTEYLRSHPKKDGEQWSGVAERLNVDGVREGDSVVFILPPGYVDWIEDGGYEVCLLGKDGSLKSSFPGMLISDISYGPVEGGGFPPPKDEDDGGGSKSNPWDFVGEHYPMGTVIERAIKNITEFGIFIGIEDGIDGLIRVSDISWTKKFNHPGELYKVGDVVQAKVLSVDEENKKLILGMKQLTEDPWASVPARYPVGKEITGTVINVTASGLFVEVEEGIEGFIQVTELGKKVNSPSELFKEGDSVQAKIIHVSAEERRLGLSFDQPKPPSPPPAEPKKNKTPLIAGLVIVALLAAGGAYIFLSQPDCPTTAECVRKFIMKGDKNAEAAMELASRLKIETSEDKDAVYRLFYLAAEAGHPEGIKRLLDCIDPTKPAWGSMPKDGREAWHLYGKLPDGEAARQALKQWTLDEAAKGNKEAAEWLKDMR